MLIFEEGFEGCSIGFTHSARWAAVGTAKLDDAVAAPGSRASLSLFSGAPGNAFTQSGVERAWQGHTRPTRLRLSVRLAERQLAKAFVLLCQPDAGDDGEHVAVWLYCSGNERRHTAEQGRIGLLGQDGFFAGVPAARASPRGRERARLPRAGEGRGAARAGGGRGRHAGARRGDPGAVI